MGRAPCCDKANVKRGPWSPDEDATLKSYLQTYGTGGNWIALPRKAGLRRCGKSCRLRWLNYLRPDIRHGGFTEEEDRLICNLYNQMGSRWSVIASQLPGRTDNDVKNYWNTKLKKKFSSGKISLTSNSTSTTSVQLIPSTDNIATTLPGSNLPSEVPDQPPNSHVSLKAETYDSSFPNPETQNSATSRMLTDTDNIIPGLTFYDHQRFSSQYDPNYLYNNNYPRLIDFSANAEGSSIADSSLILADTGQNGSASMDFGFDLPYDVFDGVSLEEKAGCRDQVAPTCCISLSDLGRVEIRPPAGLNQSIINNY